MSYGRRLEQPRRQLVEQRLERVVVVLVHDNDVDVGVLQLPGGTDPGEAAAENEHPRSLAAGGVRHDLRQTERPTWSRSRMVRSAAPPTTAAAIMTMSNCETMCPPPEC